MVIALRIYAQVMRIIRGAPLFRYSRITPQLYVGGQHRRHGLWRMHDEGITVIVNLRQKLDDSRKGIQLDHYLHLPTRDNTPPKYDQLLEGVTFIKAQLALGRKVYVHCGVGVGRAPTLVAAFLVSEGMTSTDAWREIRAIRPFIMPLRQQLRQVERFAESVSN